MQSYKRNPENKGGAEQTANSHILAPQGLPEKYQLVFISWSNQMKKRVKTLRECKLSHVTDTDTGVYFVGYYDYGIKVVSVPFILWYNREKNQFFLFNNVDISFEKPGFTC